MNFNLHPLGYPPPVLNWYKMNEDGTPNVITNTDEYDIDVLLSHGQTLSAYEVSVGV